MWRTRWIVVSVAGVAAGLFAWNWLVPQDGAVSRSDRVAVARQDTRRRALEEAMAATQSAAKPSRAAPSPDYATAYRDADDLLAYVHSLAPAVDRGDANAMYWVFRASRRCTRDYLLYLGGPERSR